MKWNSTYTAGSLTRLSELASMLDCSLLRYLQQVRPWQKRPYLMLDEATHRLASEHGQYAEAIVSLLHKRRFSLGAFSFPMEFTYYNDLSLEYLAPRILNAQRNLAATAKEVFREMAVVGDREAHELVESLLVSLRRYDGLMEVLLAANRVAAHQSIANCDALSTTRSNLRTEDRDDAVSLQPWVAA